MSLSRAARAIGVRACSAAPIQTLMQPGSRAFASFDERERGEDTPLIGLCSCMTVVKSIVARKLNSASAVVAMTWICLDPRPRNLCMRTAGTFQA